MTAAAARANDFTGIILPDDVTPVPPLPAGPTRMIVWPDPSTFRLRCPAESPEGLVGPVLGYGTCLGNVFPDGRCMKWFDPRVRAREGDFVLVELHEDVLAEIVEKNRHRPGFLEMYGENPSRYTTKMLRYYRGQHYIFNRDSGIPLCGPLGPNKLIGVCRYVLIDGKPAYGSGPDHCGWAVPAMPSAEIILNDASGQVSTVQISADSVTTIGASAVATDSFIGSKDWISVTIPAIGVAYRLLAIATFDGWATVDDEDGWLQIEVREDDDEGTLVSLSERVDILGHETETGRLRAAMTEDFAASSGQQYFVSVRALTSQSTSWQLRNGHLLVQAQKR